MAEKDIWHLNVRPAFDEYESIVAAVMHRARVRSLDLKRGKSVEAGFFLIAAVIALRVLITGSGGVGSAVEGEVKSWEAAYLEWFERMRAKFPKDVDSDQAKRMALEEFDNLIAVSVRRPEIIWQSDAAAALRGRGDKLDSMPTAGGGQPRPRRQAPAKLPAKQGMSISAEDFLPCKLIAYAPELGDPKFGLTFSAFDAADERFAARSAENDGNGWQEIVERLLKKRDPKALRDIAFDCESSMFCVRSSKLDALAAVRDIIRAIFADDNLLDEGLKKPRTRKR